VLQIGFSSSLAGAITECGGKEGERKEKGARREREGREKGQENANPN
jgi:hypothetical protein